MEWTGRFMLDPNETAMENLWRAAFVATLVIGRSHAFWGLRFETRQELLERITLQTVLHFLDHKVRQHKYARVARDGRALTFFDNVLSSAWSVSRWNVDIFMNELTRRTTTDDISPLAPFIGTDSRLPAYVSKAEYKRIMFGTATDELKRPADRAKRIAKEYEDYAADCEDLGVTALSFDAWLVSTGYNRDVDMMLALDPEAPRKPPSDRYRPDSALTPEQLRKRKYNRDYARRRKCREELEKQFLEVMENAL